MTRDELITLIDERIALAQRKSAEALTASPKTQGRGTEPFGPHVLQLSDDPHVCALVKGHLSLGHVALAADAARTARVCVHPADLSDRERETLVRDFYQTCKAGDDTTFPAKWWRPLVDEHQRKEEQARAARRAAVRNIPPHESTLLESADAPGVVR